jgi:hypothetical protein
MCTPTWVSRNLDTDGEVADGLKMPKSPTANRRFRRPFFHRFALKT